MLLAISAYLPFKEKNITKDLGWSPAVTPRGGKKIAAANAHPRYTLPALPHNNPTLITSGRVVVKKDRVLPSYALNPKP